MHTMVLSSFSVSNRYRKGRECQRISDAASLMPLSNPMMTSELRTHQQNKANEGIQPSEKGKTMLTKKMGTKWQVIN